MSNALAQAAPGLDSLRPGVLTERLLPGASSQQYLAYLPLQHRRNRRPLVFVHGYSRRVSEQAEALLPLAEALGCPLLAPLYSREVHPRYQRLARGRDGQRADRVLEDCLLDLFGPAVQEVDLVGFSGGAQFAHRYVMAHPHRVASLVAIAAGWYTLPESDLRYPLGLQTRRSLRGCSLNPERFLRVPTTVIVGDRDTGSQNLRRSAQLDALQGKTRVARARNWVARMRLAAERYRIPAQIRYLEVPGVGHDFHDFVARAFLLSLIREGVDDGCALRLASSAAAAPREAAPGVPG
jgi:pimeloyl-ACP methyl ester carboxylesterase